MNTCAIARLGRIAGSVQALENTIKIRTIALKIQSTNGSTCKGKETFTFAGRAWGGLESQKIKFTGLLHPIFFRKKREVHLFGVCVVKWRNTAT